MGVFANVVIEIAVILMPLFVIKRGVEEKRPPLEIVYTAISYCSGFVFGKR